MKSSSSWLQWVQLTGVVALLISGCGGDSSPVDPGTTDGGENPGATDGGSTGTDGGAGTDGGTGADGGTGSDGGTATPFSFFVTSLKAMQELSGRQSGFGGDLRFGETGQGAGLRGADKICAAIAERSMPGAGQKPWRAFLSATAGEDGNRVNAIDRIGNGPWYDRLGRVLANSKADLLHARPTGGSAVIQNDFPNEDGVPNHRPDPSQSAVDNHDTLTGSNSSGQLYSTTATCLDWTSAAGNKATEGRPRVGHSWPRSGGGGGQDNWMSSLDESGCAPGVNLVEMGPPDPNSNTVGSGGGYGGIYCFSLVP